jgi:LacI family transcriptional regulator
MEGYKAAMEAAGIQILPEWIQRGEGVYQFGVEAASRLLRLTPEKRPTAIVAFNDFMAIGAMHAVQASGLVVGKHIAITGFDDIPLVQYLNPSLTSVRQPIWEIGQSVFNILLGILNEQADVDSHVLIRPRLIVRGSSGLDLAS